MFFTSEFLDKILAGHKPTISECVENMKSISKTDFPNHKYVAKDIARFLMQALIEYRQVEKI